jgi:hypothetical protein
MRNQSTKKINRTFSIPVDLFQDLQSRLKMNQQEMEHFIIEAIRKELNAKSGNAYLMDTQEEWLLEESKCWQNTLDDDWSDEW